MSYLSNMTSHWQENVNKSLNKFLKHNDLTLGDLLSNDQRALAFSIPSRWLVRQAWLKGREVRVIDNDITPHNSRWSAASTKKINECVRER